MSLFVSCNCARNVFHACLDKGRSPDEQLNKYNAYEYTTYIQVSMLPYFLTVLYVVTFCDSKKAD
jgi:hypothetical protein